jgi:hypothetical protein
MFAYQFAVLFFSVALTALCMSEKHQRLPGKVKNIRSQAATSSSPPSLPHVDVVGVLPPDQRISLDPLPSSLGPGSGDGGDHGVGPYGLQLDPGVDCFYGWNKDNPSLSNSAPGDFLPVGTGRGLPGQPVIITSAGIKVSASREGGIVVRPLIQVRNLSSESISTLSFVFLSGLDRYYTQPLAIEAPPNTDYLIGEHLEFYFVRFPSGPPTLDLLIDRVEFQRGRDWTWGFLTSSCDGDTAPQPIQKAEASYTEAALKHRTSGRVLLKVLVGTDGRPVWVYLMKGLPWGLNENGVRAALSMAFQPATTHGRATSCWADLAIPFFPPRSSTRNRKANSIQQ